MAKARIKTIAMTTCATCAAEFRITEADWQNALTGDAATINVRCGPSAAHHELSITVCDEDDVPSITIGVTHRENRALQQTNP